MVPPCMKWTEETRAKMYTCPTLPVRRLRGRTTKGQGLCEGWVVTLALHLLSLPRWRRGRGGLGVWFSGPVLGSIPTTTEKEENKVCLPWSDPSKMASSPVSWAMWSLGPVNKSTLNKSYQKKDSMPALESGIRPSCLLQRGRVLTPTAQA